VLVNVSSDVSSRLGPVQQELTGIRQQLQSMKKHTKLALEQSRKSSDRERAALRRAEEFFVLKEIATANVASASRRENYMLDLMIDASQNMAGTCFMSWYLLFVTMFISLSHLLHFLYHSLQVHLLMMLPRNRGLILESIIFFVLLKLTILTFGEMKIGVAVLFCSRIVLPKSGTFLTSAIVL
jgi:hypothetical protein